MENTYVPLDIAFLDDLGRVMQIIHGKPLDTTVLRPSSAYTFVLEVAGGWFDRHNLGVGATVHMPPGLPERAVRRGGTCHAGRQCDTARGFTG